MKKGLKARNALAKDCLSHLRGMSLVDIVITTNQAIDEKLAELGMTPDQLENFLDTSKTYGLLPGDK